MTRISGSAPARRSARAVSYSQLVPGKTGMSALGRANFVPAARGEPAAKFSFRTCSLPWPGALRSGMTGSSLPSQAAWTASSSTRSPPQEKA